MSRIEVNYYNLSPSSFGFKPTSMASASSGDIMSTIADDRSPASLKMLSPSVFHRATSDQLTNVIKRINPFDETFREANKALRSQVYMPAMVPMYQDETNSDSSKCMTNYFTPLDDHLSHVQRYLSVKLPDVPTATTTSGSVGSSTMETPDMTTLINHMITKTSNLSPRSAPQTADVLKTALDMRERVEIEREKVKDATTELSPNCWPPCNVRNKNEHALPHVFVSHSSSSSRESQSDELPQTETEKESSHVLISLKVGDRSVLIPMEINLADSKRTPTPLSPSHGSFVSMSPSLIGALSATDRYSATYQTSEIEFLQKTERRNTLDTSPSASPSDFEKKKETLERNKEAAWRYRKRKKEEKRFLEDRVKVLENEKLELTTQVAVLKTELIRINKILDVQKHLFAQKSSPEDSQRSVKRTRSPSVLLSNNQQAKFIKLHSSVEDLSPSVLIGTTVARSPKIYQYISAAQHADPSVYHPVVFHNGQFVIPSSPHFQ